MVQTKVRSLAFRYRGLGGGVMGNRVGGWEGGGGGWAPVIQTDDCLPHVHRIRGEMMW